jgi:hypothetical protein
MLGRRDTGGCGYWEIRLEAAMIAEGRRLEGRSSKKLESGACTSNPSRSEEGKRGAEGGGRRCDLPRVGFSNSLLLFVSLFPLRTRAERFKFVFKICPDLISYYHQCR